MTVARTSARLGPYVALGYRFTIRCDDPALAAPVDAALSQLRGEEPARDDGNLYRLVGARDRYGLVHDQRVLVRAGTAARALGTLMWDVNQQAVASAAADHMVLHAAAVVRDGGVLVLAGPAESGKTTLVTALLGRGWRYLTDEAAAISLDTGLVRPYPKPLSLDPGSQALFPELRPTDGAAPRSLAGGQWQVPASTVRADAVGEPAPLAAVIFPRHVPAASTELQPLSRARALARLADCAFTWSAPYGPRFRRLAEWLRSARCADLVVDDLDKAGAAVDAFWSRS